MLHGLPVRGRRLDPSDPNAYRCEWGGALTCDGAEAEVAAPPVRVGPGFSRSVEGWACVAGDELRSVLGEGFSLEGYSTHLSVAIDSRLGDRVARVYSQHFAPAVMLLTSHEKTPGLLVRPRPARLELGTEYVAGAHLRGAAVFAVGSVIASVRAASAPFHRRARTGLPPMLQVRTQPAVERYGLYVDRAAFGEDLFRGGRDTMLYRTSGRSITAQQHLEVAWECAREALEGLAAPDDLEATELMVVARLPLPVEAGGTGTFAGSNERPHSPLGGVIVARCRPDYQVRAFLATWSFSVFEIERRDEGRTAYCCIPLDVLDQFLHELDAGVLDATITAFLAAAPQGRVLADVRQTEEPGLFDGIGPPIGLIPAERDPGSGRLIRATGGNGRWGTGRPGKRDTRSGPWSRRLVLMVAGVIVALLAGVIFALASSGGGSNNAARIDRDDEDDEDDEGAAPCCQFDLCRACGSHRRERSS